MTAFTKAQRSQFVRQLEACKPFLWDGKSPWGFEQTRHICIAVTYGADDPKHAVTLRREIERRLENTLTLGVWLCDRGIPPDDLTDARLQAHRHAWVDLLIEEFSN